MDKAKIVWINGQKLHFYTMGKGPALVMLHPSPSSATSLLPLARELAESFTIFCIDTPGYGKSDTLPEEPQDLKNYTDFLHKAFTKLGLEKPALYGSATGAQLAIRYSLEHPGMVSHLFLDNSAHFDDTLCDKILEHYFPDLTPQLNGDHLTRIWTMVSQMFQYFPWCFATGEYALNRPQMPLSILQMVAMDYLRAGEAYDVAYKLAFKHERGHYVQQLNVPTTIFRWNGSIILPYIDALLAFEFPDHINAHHINGDAFDRIAKMVAFMRKVSKELPMDVMDVSAMETPLKEKLHYKKPTENIPVLKENGEHLHDVWKALMNINPTMDAVQIQACLVDWYTPK